VLFGPDPERQFPPQSANGSSSTMAEDTGEPVTGAIPTDERAGVFRTMWLFRRVLSRLGVAAASLSAVRSARQVVLPLWGVSIGLDAQTIALVVGVSGAIDFALFYASGQVMDRFGRLWAALPAMILMGAGFLALAFTHDLSSAELWFGVFAGVLGVGNGLSSGILLTLGADVAPKANPAPFLGSWRTLTVAPARGGHHGDLVPRDRHGCHRGGRVRRRRRIPAVGPALRAALEKWLSERRDQTRRTAHTQPRRTASAPSWIRVVTAASSINSATRRCSVRTEM
jgi:hypothetical protein